MPEGIDWGRVRKIIEEGRSFLITSHVNPEGDAIGSEIALTRYLRQLSRSVRIVNPSPTPENCRFLDPDGEIILYDPSRADAVLKDVDAVFILDLSSWSQLGSFADALREREIPRVCIDHHPGPDEDIADVIVCDSSAAAAGLLIYELIREVGGTIDPPIAEAIFTALIVDTGGFRFSNADRRVFLAAADLVGGGIKPEKIYQKAFENKRWASAKLLSPVIATLERTGNGKIAWMHATREMVAKAGGKYEDLEGYIDIPRSIRGVEVCVFFKEHDSKTIRVSLRSTGGVDLHHFAKSNGGGGHSKAAGITFHGTMEEAIHSIVSGLEAVAGD